MFIVKLILFIIGCGLTALSVCIKFDIIKIKKYQDSNNIKEKDDMCYYLLISALIFLLLLLILIIIEETIILSKKGYNVAKTYGQEKYQAAKTYGQQKLNDAKQKINNLTESKPPQVANIQE